MRRGFLLAAATAPVVQPAVPVSLREVFRAWRVLAWLTQFRRLAATYVADLTPAELQENLIRLTVLEARRPAGVTEGLPSSSDSDDDPFAGIFE